MAETRERNGHGEKRGTDMLMVLREHEPEYLMEVADLAMFMISACVLATIRWHNSSSAISKEAAPVYRDGH